MSNYCGGDHVGRDKFEQHGHDNRIEVTNYGAVSQADIDAALTELRDFVAELKKTGAVTEEGAVTDPGAVVNAVNTGRGRLQALTRAIADGAKDAITSTISDGVSALIVALIGGQP